MLYKRKVVEVRPQTITSEPIVEHSHTERIVEREGWSPEATMMTIIGGLVLFGLLLYFLWYRPTYIEAAPAPSVVEHRIDVNNPAPQPTTVITPPPVVNPAPSNPIIVNPPAKNDTPPVTIENHVTNPPAESGDTGTSDTSTSDTESTNP